MEADEHDKIISVFHFQKEVSRTHGVPFRFVVKPVGLLAFSHCTKLCAKIIFQHEKFAETKKRLQARIGVSDKDIAKYRFALIQVATFKQPSYIEDGERPILLVVSLHRLDIPEDTIYDHKFAPEDVLGLDHVDKSGKTRTGAGEKAIVIRG